MVRVDHRPSSDVSSTGIVISVSTRTPINYCMRELGSRFAFAWKSRGGLFESGQTSSTTRSIIGKYQNAMKFDREKRVAGRFERDTQQFVMISVDVDDAKRWSVVRSQYQLV